jgi:hypothetical protein
MRLPYLRAPDLTLKSNSSGFRRRRPDDDGQMCRCDERAAVHTRTERHRKGPSLFPHRTASDFHRLVGDFENGDLFVSVVGGGAIHKSSFQPSPSQAELTKESHPPGQRRIESDPALY